MKHKLFYWAALALISATTTAQVVDVSVYADCSKNGYTREIHYAPVSSTSGRTSCEWVQLWENGPKWATFNVGATITDYANLTAGTDATSGNVAYYNTANVGGLYAWNNPNLNGRKTTWGSSVSTGIADVATTLWGSNWKTPTKAQLDTLQNSSYGKTTWIWCDGSTTQYVKGCTLKGYKVSGVGAYAGMSVFLPAAGFFFYYDGTVYGSGGIGYCWSSAEGGSYGAYYLYFVSDYRDFYIYGGYREYGHSVRAVLAQ